MISLFIIIVNFFNRIFASVVHVIL